MHHALSGENARRLDWRSALLPESFPAFSWTGPSARQDGGFPDTEKGGRIEIPFPPSFGPR
ncbi:hypothetical protein V473_19030 [Sphingobium cupriresistens LL01]|uniref:Uncharacterized protein n=1 Tax=Sphingobium cupriresistens LL01 TaxID=1420583 RepID=A0A0J7XQM3_9SPHN|nr:hypothetical protein V473_19030 [Sphingobium cupriresistens LL01]